MQFRRSGQRDDRRRRVLTDAMLGSSEQRRCGPRRRSSEIDRPHHKSANYGDAAFMDEQSRLTDLVPLRLPVFLIPLVVGVAIIAGLEALYSWMPRLASMTTDGRVAAFDLDGEGSLAVWFSTMTLSAAGLAALLVFTVRRFKVDDYHGHYRVWIWAAMCWFLIGLDETASLHEGFKEMMSVISGTRIFGDGSIWWVIPYFFLLGAVGTRLLVDMRCCWLSSATMILAAGCYAVGVAAQLGLLLPESGARGVMLEEGAEMLGNLFVLLAMALHARYVIMDAQGMLPRVDDENENLPEEMASGFAEEIDEEAATAEGEEEAAQLREIAIHPPHRMSPPSTATAARSTRPVAPRRAAAAPDPSPPVFYDDLNADEAEASSAQAKMTKAERKALRRRLEKMKRDRQRQA